MPARASSILLFLLIACGSSHQGDAVGTSDGGVVVPLPPFPLERREVDLSDEEFREFCEWWTSQWYSDPEDRSFWCVDGMVEGTYLSVELCILSRPDPATTPDCPFTVGDWYGCISSSPNRPDRCMPAPPQCLRPEGCGVGAVCI